MSNPIPTIALVGTGPFTGNVEFVVDVPAPGAAASPPTGVAITSHADGATVTAAEAFTVSGTQTGGVSGILYDGTTSLGAVTIASGTWSKSVTLAAGAHALKVAITNPDGTTESAVVDLTAEATQTGTPTTVTLARTASSTGYQGITDVKLEEGTAADTNAGLSTTMEITHSTSGARKHSLLRFDLQAAGFEITGPITAATFGFTVGTSSVDANPRTVRFYRCLRPWVEVEATWNSASTGVAWGTPGALQAGVDYDTTILAEATLLSTDTGSGTFSFTVDLNAAGVAALEAMRTGNNYGFLILPDSGNATGILGRHAYISKDGSTASQRPTLEITFLAPA